MRVAYLSSEVQRTLYTSEIGNSLPNILALPNGTHLECPSGIGFLALTQVRGGTLPLSHKSSNAFCQFFSSTEVACISAWAACRASNSVSTATTTGGGGGNFSPFARRRAPIPLNCSRFVFTTWRNQSMEAFKSHSSAHSRTILENPGLPFST